MANTLTQLKDKVTSSDQYKKWEATNQNNIFSHFFTQINQNYVPTTAWDIAFYNTDSEKITVFTINEANEVVQKNTDDVFKQKQSQVHELKLTKETLDFTDSIVPCQKAIQESFPDLDPLRGNGFAILQSLQNDTKEEEEILATWNISFITKKLSFLNIKINANTGELISTKEHSMLQK